MNETFKPLELLCNVDYGTRVVQKRDGGSGYPVYGGGGATFSMDSFNRENRAVVARFGISPKCTRIVSGKFFLNDSGLTVSPKNDNLDSRFLDYQMLHLNEIIYALGKGSAQKNLDVPAFRRLPIYAPALPEQHRVVGILDKAFEKIAIAKANTEKNVANAREISARILDSLLDKHRLDWVETNLGDKAFLDIIDGDRGSHYPKHSDFSAKGYCLFLNTKNVRPYGFEFDSTMFISKEKDDQLRKGKLKRNDVVMTTRGTIGNVGLYSDQVEFENVRINSGMLIFRANSKTLRSDFLFELLRSRFVRAQIEKHTSGAAQPQLPIRTLVDFTILVPRHLSEQDEMVLRIRERIATSSRLEGVYLQRLDTFAALEQSMLSAAFNGEL